jgi:hypothetical protein
MSDLLSRTLGETISIETVRGGGLWLTEVDKTQLESALLNLAINARDAMPAGGKLTIETGNAFLDEAYCASADGVTPGQYVMIAMSDTGTGMSADVIDKAFDPFFTTKAAGAGTGLGLSQVHGFVKQSEGHIGIYSELGEGTTVKVYLPRSFAGARKRPSEAQAPEIPKGSQETVLVVEDERCALSSPNLARPQLPGPGSRRRRGSASAGSPIRGDRPAAHGCGDARHERPRARRRRTTTSPRPEDPPI